YTRPHVLFTAKRAFSWKGGPLLVEAVRRAASRMPGLRLTIVGEPRHVREFDGMPHVTALGHVPRDHLQSLFERASLYAMPAVLEPWGLVYLEALSTKTPILGLRRHAIPELTADGRFGFLVDRPEPDAVAEALVDALSDAGRLQ